MNLILARGKCLLEEKADLMIVVRDAHHGFLHRAWYSRLRFMDSDDGQRTPKRDGEVEALLESSSSLLRFNMPA